MPSPTAAAMAARVLELLSEVTIVFVCEQCETFYELDPGFITHSRFAQTLAEDLDDILRRRLEMEQPIP